MIPTEFRILETSLYEEMEENDSIPCDPTTPMTEFTGDGCLSETPIALRFR